MGCDYYETEGPLIHFSEQDDSAGCLCTFPHNDGEEMTVDRVESLALLGAALVLVHQVVLTGEYVMIPDDIPKWIRDGIRSCLRAQERRGR